VGKSFQLDTLRYPSSVDSDCCVKGQNCYVLIRAVFNRVKKVVKQLMWLSSQAPLRLFKFSCLPSGAYSRAALVQVRRLFESGVYSKATLILKALITKTKLLHEHFSLSYQPHEYFSTFISTAFHSMSMT